MGDTVKPMFYCLAVSVIFLCGVQTLLKDMTSDVGWTVLGIAMVLAIPIYYGLFYILFHVGKTIYERFILSPKRLTFDEALHAVPQSKDYYEEIIGEYKRYKICRSISHKTRGLEITIVVRNKKTGIGIDLYSLKETR